MGGNTDPGSLPYVTDPLEDVIRDITRGIPEPYRTEVKAQIRTQIQREQEAAARRAREAAAAAEAASREAAAAAAAAALESAEAQARDVEKFLAMDVYELDKVFPKDPDVLRYELLHGEPIEYRVKMLELALMRGGSYPYGALMAGQLMIEGAEAKMAYQKMAVEAVLGRGGEELFERISMSFDAPPNTNRVPATQLMYMMLQENGLKGGNDGRVEVERWMRSLDPEVRGRAMYHLVDAAATRQFGSSGRLTGFDTPLGGAQWQYGADSWESTVRNIESTIVGDLKTTKSEEEEAFQNGWNSANSSVGGTVGKEGS